MNRSASFRMSHAGLWVVAAIVLSASLSSLCIAVFAALAMGVETGLGRDAGLAVNWAALALMVLSYAALLTLVLRPIKRRHRLPLALWVGLVLYPLVWIILIATSAPGVYATTPAVVSLGGAVGAWLLLGRAHDRAVSAPASPA